VQANLRAHPSKIENAPSLLETTFESFNFHSGMRVRNETQAQSRLRRPQVALLYLTLNIARVLLRFDHVARFIINANHSVM
jgi:hypothetical protein